MMKTDSYYERIKRNKMQSTEQMSDIIQTILLNVGFYFQVVNFPLAMFTEDLCGNTIFLLVLDDSLHDERFALENDFIFLWKKPKSSPFKDTRQLFQHILVTLKKAV